MNFFDNGFQNDNKKMLTFPEDAFHERKFWKGIRRLLRDKRIRKAAGMITLSLAYALLICPEIVMASGAASVTASFNTLKEIVVALVTSVGTIVLLWGFFEWGTSLQSQEGVMQANAFKRIGGGLVMVLAPQLITAFVS